MMACDPTISPPAPMPWIARQAISSSIDCDSPESIEPTRKITIASWKKLFRPNRSPSLPHSGVGREASR